MDSGCAAIPAGTHSASVTPGEDNSSDSSAARIIVMDIPGKTQFDSEKQVTQMNRFAPSYRNQHEK